MGSETWKKEETGLSILSRLFWPWRACTNIFPWILLSNCNKVDVQGYIRSLSICFKGYSSWFKNAKDI